MLIAENFLVINNLYQKPQFLVQIVLARFFYKKTIRCCKIIFSPS